MPCCAAAMVTNGSGDGNEKKERGAEASAGRAARTDRGARQDGRSQRITITSPLVSYALSSSSLLVPCQPRDAVPVIPPVKRRIAGRLALRPLTDSSQPGAQWRSKHPNVPLPGLLHTPSFPVSPSSALTACCCCCCQRSRLTARFVHRPTCSAGV